MRGLTNCRHSDKWKEGFIIFFSSLITLHCDLVICGYFIRIKSLLQLVKIIYNSYSQKNLARHSEMKTSIKKKKNQQKLWNIIKITQTFNFTLQTYQNLQITRSLPHLQIVLKMTFMPFRVQYFYFFYLQMLRLVEVLGQSQWCFAH